MKDTMYSMIGTQRDPRLMINGVTMKQVADDPILKHSTVTLRGMSLPLISTILCEPYQWYLCSPQESRAILSLGSLWEWARRGISS